MLVLLRPISPDMGEVGGTNPPGAAKNKNPARGQVFVLDWPREGIPSTASILRRVMCQTKLKIHSEFNSVSTWHSSNKVILIESVQVKAVSIVALI